MNTCKTCHFYDKQDTEPETGTCYGDPPRNILLPMPVNGGPLLAPSKGQQSMKMSIQSMRPAVMADERACHLWRAQEQ